MGGFLNLKEDRPTPKNVYNMKLFTSTLISSFAAIMIGYDSAL